MSDFLFEPDLSQVFNVDVELWRLLATTQTNVEVEVIVAYILQH